MLADATRADVVHRLLVQLTYCCAVVAFHIVGVDFKEGFGGDVCFVGQRDVAVGLVGHGPLCIWAHQNVPEEMGGCRLIHNALVKLVAFTVWHLVVHKYLTVNMLLFVHQI